MKKVILFIFLFIVCFPVYASELKTSLSGNTNVDAKGEFELAFATKFFPICKELRQYPAISRYAFAVWLGLSMADGKLEESDRQIIKTLQKMFSENFDLDKYSKPNNKWLDNVPADNWLTTRLAVAFIRKYDNNIISDDFLNELEDNCKII